MSDTALRTGGQILVEQLRIQGVEMVPALPASPLDNDKVRSFQHFQMLHDRAAIEFRKLAGQRASRQRLVAKRVEDRSAMVRCEGAENPVLMLADST